MSAVLRIGSNRSEAIALASVRTQAHQSTNRVRAAVTLVAAYARCSCKRIA